MRLAILLLAFSCIAASAQQRSSWERIGDLRVNRTHAAWPSPESIIRDVRSQDRTVRLKALRLVGTDKMEEIFADAGPDEIELRYASLGGDRTKQAIVLVEAASYAYAAVRYPRRTHGSASLSSSAGASTEAPRFWTISSASNTHLTAFQTWCCEPAEVAPASTSRPRRALPCKVLRSTRCCPSYAEDARARSGPKRVFMRAVPSAAINSWRPRRRSPAN